MFCIPLVLVLALPFALAIPNAVRHYWLTRSDGSRAKVPPRLSVRGWIDEVAATVLAYGGGWTALLRRAPAAAQPTIVLVQHSRWPGASWLLERRLASLGWALRRVYADLACNDATLDALANECGQRPPQPTVLLGLGNGGLIARHLALRLGERTRLLTVATPHRGTDTGGAALRPGSTLISTLETTDPSAGRPFEAVALYSPGDAWIEPTDAAYYAGAFNIEVRDTGHYSMLFSQRVFQLIAENLPSLAAGHDAA